MHVLAAAPRRAREGPDPRPGYVADDDGLDPGDARRLTRFWTVTAVAMVVLGVNKQLDLQTWLIEHARRAAFAEGWYDDRRRVQAVFVLAVAAAGLGVPPGGASDSCAAWPIRWPSRSWASA